MSSGASSAPIFAMILSPSLLSANFSCLGEECAALEQAGVQWLHLDVIDGVFAPNITFGTPVIASLRKVSGLFFDVHLMVDTPSRYLEAFAKAGADMLVVHMEAETHLQRCLARIRELGLRAGVALNPSTDIAPLRWLVRDLDMVLLMSVNPGFSGQKFLPCVEEKITAVRQLLDDNGGQDIPVQVDGGVCPENIGRLVSRGADIFVSGSAFFNHPPYGKRLQEFTDAASQGPLRAAAASCSLWKPRSASK